MIKFTPEQQATVDYILEQIHAGAAGQNVIVSGQGGVGKTEMVCELVCMLLDEGYRVAVTAMTGKATAVLRGKVWKKIREKGMVDRVNKESGKKDQLLIETVQKLTKKTVVLGQTATGETKYSNTWRNPASFDYDVLIIDELSMVPNFVSLWWQKTRCRVIGLGDFCQLPEVVTAETQKELAGFRHDLKIPAQGMVSGYGVKVLKNLAQCQLTKVLRSDNDIANLCNDLRDFSMTRRELVDRMKYWAGKSPDIEYCTSISELETSDDWQIICYTNKTCQKINDQLALGFGYPEEDDKVLLFDNLNPLRMYNGDTIRFGDLLDRVAEYKQKRPIFVVFKWQGKMPNIRSVYAQERASAQSFMAYKEMSKKIAIDRAAMLPDIIMSAPFLGQGMGENYVDDLKDFRKQYTDDTEYVFSVIKQLEEVDKDLADYIVEALPRMPSCYIVNLDYGYAITTHKSQGSEYENVCYILEKFDKPLLYTGLSRAKKKLKIINLTKEA